MHTQHPFNRIEAKPGKKEKKIVHRTESVNRLNWDPKKRQEKEKNAAEAKRQLYHAE